MVPADRLHLSVRVHVTPRIDRVAHRLGRSVGTGIDGLKVHIFAGKRRLRFEGQGDILLLSW
jgi:hypothetical protein